MPLVGSGLNNLAGGLYTMNQEEINDLMWANTPGWRKEQLMSERVGYELTRGIFESYDRRRKFAQQLLQAYGMKEAIIDELKQIGFIITETSV